MTTTEFVTLRRSIEQLRVSVAGMRYAFGDTPGIRRLVNDLERLEIDASELASAQLAPRAGNPGVLADHVVVPDTPLDDSMWGDADDEGVGGYHGTRP